MFSIVYFTATRADIETKQRPRAVPNPYSAYRTRMLHLRNKAPIMNSHKRLRRPAVGQSPAPIPGIQGSYLAISALPGGQLITQFKTKWTVPPPPSEISDPPQGLALWTGLETANASGWLLPVNDWDSESGTWTVYTWLVDGQQPWLTSDRIPVNPGDELEGVVACEVVEGKLKYQVSFTGPKFSSISQTLLTAVNFNRLVVEFHVFSESSVPPSLLLPNDLLVRMRGISVTTTAGQPSDLPWRFSMDAQYQIQTPSGKNGIIASTSGTNGEIDFYFR